MRNIDDSEWLRNPQLEGIQYSGDGPDKEGDFTLFANQIRIGDEEELP